MNAPAGTLFANLCELSRDIVIVVVPFAQVQHESEDWKDYWRFTPTCIRKLFGENCLDLVYEAASAYKNAGVYLLCVASRLPDRWQGVLPLSAPSQSTGDWIGRTWTQQTRGQASDVLIGVRS